MIEHGRAKIDNSSGRLSISIPSKKNWFSLLFGTAWMVPWYFVFQVALRAFNGDKTENSGTGGSAGFNLALWAIFGISNAILLLWGYFGQERFVTYGGEVLLGKSVFGIGLKKRLDANEIKNIRVDQSGTGSGWFNRKRIAVWGRGKIKFEYRLKTFSFGLGIDDAESVHIVEIMKERFRN